ncbi:hypothetical protein [Luteibacter sp. SG786]|uniref:hypothetical protein n=1 Tax=Luteibacter sp. SG786 TaxID=2587130 RepID=UPI001421A20D|nr:hypothetical protein [Luteibacter sp. SG786]NII53908.1 hypothetical protein [Luteibacter sp. SG786]
MTASEKLRHGTEAWFEMVGNLMCEAALRGGLAPDTNVSLVERYTDGATLSEGLVQGLRFDIVDGVPSFRAGARPDERGDITIEITTAAAKSLNLLLSADPAYGAAADRFMQSGAMRVHGDLSRLGAWLQYVHDPIVARTI